METPSSPSPEHRSLLGLVLRLAALTLVGGLLALLVWRVVNAGQGGRLVNAVREHKKPIAPDFRLGVLWPHAETWPRSTRVITPLRFRWSSRIEIVSFFMHDILYDIFGIVKSANVWSPTEVRSYCAR